MCKRKEKIKYTFNKSKKKKKKHHSVTLSICEIIKVFEKRFLILIEFITIISIVRKVHMPCNCPHIRKFKTDKVTKA